MTTATAEASVVFSLAESKSRAVAALLAAHGDAHRAAIEAGVKRVADRWSEQDGDAAAFEAFCAKHFVSDPVQRERLLARLEGALEQIEGHLYEMRRTLRRHHDLRGDGFPASTTCSRSSIRRPTCPSSSTARRSATSRC